MILEVRPVTKPFVIEPVRPIRHTISPYPLKQLMQTCFWSP